MLPEKKFHYKISEFKKNFEHSIDVYDFWHGISLLRHSGGVDYRSNRVKNSKSAMVPKKERKKKGTTRSIPKDRFFVAGRVSCWVCRFFPDTIDGFSRCVFQTVTRSALVRTADTYVYGIGLQLEHAGPTLPATFILVPVCYTRPCPSPYPSLLLLRSVCASSSG